VQFQLNGSGWALSKGAADCHGPCYWANPGAGTDSVVWVSDKPLVGDYQVEVWYDGTGGPGKALASNADFTIRFKGRSLSIPVDQNRDQRRWKVLGRFSDPISVELTNRADGPVVSGSVRLVRIK
jgi:hypothetical protein